jgi:ABC-type multidrug transport system ATPase subunit
MYATRPPGVHQGPTSRTSDDALVPAQPRVDPAFHQPVVTSKWWTAALWAFREADFCQAMYAHPLALKAAPLGLGLCYPTRLEMSADQRMYGYPYEEDLVVGLAGNEAGDFGVAGYGDWTATLRWHGAGGGWQARAGRGLPYAWFEREGCDRAAEVRCAAAPEVWHDDGPTLAFELNGRNYALFGPAGSRWRRSGSASWRNDLAGRDYWSVAALPGRHADTLALFERHAHVVVTDSRVAWHYDVAAATVTSDFELVTAPREGTETRPLVALYPHQWKHSDVELTDHRYGSPRGVMKLACTSRFSTRLRVPPLLPRLPTPTEIDRDELVRLVDDAAADRESSLWPQPLESLAPDDAYWSGKAFGRLVQLAGVAEATGQQAAQRLFLAKIRAKLAQFFDGSDEPCFCYDPRWRSLIFYPAAAHGLDSALNDHQYAYGYFLRAVVAVLQDDPGWWDEGDNAFMVQAILRDVANPDRRDRRFPFLRHFDAYAGHSWGSGAAADSAGLNAEPSSEAILFAQSVLMLGLTIGGTEGEQLRDLGAWLYAHEVVAAEQYWFNQDGDVFPWRYPWPVAGIVWGSGARYGTWWADGPEEVHGINLVPMHAGSLYLARKPARARERHASMLELARGAVRTWRDVHQMHEALFAPAQALAAHRAEWGSSREATSHWLQALGALGTLCADVSADTPCHAVFERDGRRSYVAANLGPQPVRVRFADGVVLAVAARSLVLHGPAPAARQDAGGSPVLQVQRLAKDYAAPRASGRRTLDGLSLQIDAGRCLGLLGANGAGKSTAIACIVGLYPPSEGRVMIAGHDVHREPKAARRHLGVCLQDDTLDTDLCVIDQLLRHAAYHGLPRREAHERSGALLERFGLGSRARAMAGELSGGMRRVLQIAHALIADPALLVLDEPSTGLDPEVRRLLWDELKRRQHAGLALLLTTHYMEEAQVLCDDLVLLHEGREVERGSVSELLARHPGAASLEAVYLRVAAGRIGKEVPLASA